MYREKQGNNNYGNLGKTISEGHNTSSSWWYKWLRNLNQETRLEKMFQLP